jgi:hypothetical protein
LAAFRHRELSAGRFAAEQGVSVGSLYRWAQESGHGFREVEPVVAAAPAGGLRLRAGALLLEFDTLPPCEYLQSLLQAFAGC